MNLEVKPFHIPKPIGGQLGGGISPPLIPASKTPEALINKIRDFVEGFNIQIEAKSPYYQYLECKQLLLSLHTFVILTHPQFMDTWEMPEDGILWSIDVGGDAWWQFGGASALLRPSLSLLTDSSSGLKDLSFGFHEFYVSLAPPVDPDADVEDCLFAVTNGTEFEACACVIFTSHTRSELLSLRVRHRAMDDYGGVRISRRPRPGEPLRQGELEGPGTAWLVSFEGGSIQAGEDLPFGPPLPG